MAPAASSDAANGSVAGDGPIFSCANNGGGNYVHDIDVGDKISGSRQRDETEQRRG